MALAVVGIVMLTTSMAAFAQTKGPEFGLLDVTAEATGIGLQGGNPTSSPYPAAAALLPNASATLATGPSGTARSSILWPGPLVGSFGSLVNVIGTPLPPELVSQTNYPVVASAEAGAGGEDAETLGPMTASVKGSDSKASTALSDVAVPEVLSVGRVVTTARSFLDDAGNAAAEARSELQGVEIGPLRIASITAIAKGSTDGTTATTTHELSFTGATLGDRPITFGPDGIHVGDAVVPVGQVLDGAKPATDEFGLTAYVTQPIEQKTADGTATLHSGSLIVDWSPPPDPTGKLPPGRFTFVLGGASVVLNATLGSAVEGAAGESDGFFAPADPGTVLPTPGLSAPTESGASLPGPSLGGGGSDVGGSSPAVDAPIQGATPIELAGIVSDRVPFGWVLIGILGGLLAGTGLSSLREQAVSGALGGRRCPMEGR